MQCEGTKVSLKAAVLVGALMMGYTLGVTGLAIYWAAQNDASTAGVKEVSDDLVKVVKDMNSYIQQNNTRLSALEAKFPADVAAAQDKSKDKKN